MITASVNLGPLLKKLRQVPRDAARIIAEAVEVDARGFVKDIIAVTPPSMGKANKESQQRGATAVARDIRKVYQTPGGLYQLIKAKDTRAAAGFWQAVRQKDWQRANQIARRFSLPELIDFGSDDGTLHQSRRRQGKVTGRQASATVREQRYLKAYIKQQQTRVGLLAAGFNAAAARLGVKPPRWIARHAATIGTIRVKQTASTFAITIANNARHGTANDLPRRIKFVLQSDKRKKRLINAIRYRLRAVLKAQRLQVA